MDVMYPGEYSRPIFLAAVEDGRPLRQTMAVPTRSRITHPKRRFKDTEQSTSALSLGGSLPRRIPGRFFLSAFSASASFLAVYSFASSRKLLLWQTAVFLLGSTLGFSVSSPTVCCNQPQSSPPTPPRSDYSCWAIHNFVPQPRQAWHLSLLFFHRLWDSAGFYAETTPRFAPGFARKELLLGGAFTLGIAIALMLLLALLVLGLAEKRKNEDFERSTGLILNLAALGFGRLRSPFSHVPSPLFSLGGPKSVTRLTQLRLSGCHESAAHPPAPIPARPIVLFGGANPILPLRRSKTSTAPGQEP